MAATALTGTIRRLWPPELGLYRDHLLRLDADSRRMRFGGAVDDAFIIDYAADAGRLDSLLYAYVESALVRGAAELRRLGGVLPGQAEAAFSVEAAYQNNGIGAALLGRVIRAARNRGIRRLHMICLADNRRMQRIARKYGAVLRFEEGEAVAELMPEPANCFTLWREAVDVEHGLMLAVLDLQRRLRPTA